MRFERIDQPLANRWHFVWRVMICGLLSFLFVAVSLGLGVLGYWYFAGQSWIDALLNASMILAGMGPVTELKSDGAKLFASCYALFSGVVLLGAVAVILSPVFHRIMHRFHLEDEDLES